MRFLILTMIAFALMSCETVPAYQRGDLSAPRDGV
jgi:hypothetical protein